MSYYPPHVDVSSGSIVSTDEMRLIEFRDKCLEEYRSTREQLGITTRDERASRFLSGEGQWPRDFDQLKPYYSAIVVNIVRNVVLRKTGILTDARVQLSVTSNSKNTAAASTIQRTIEGLWEKRSIQQQLTDGIVLAQRSGNAPCVITWNPDLDYGRGDIDIHFLQPDQVAYDPAIGRASNLQNAEWVCISHIRPVTEFATLYPRRGHLVQPEPNLSTYDERYSKGTIIDTPVPTLMSIWKKGGKKAQRKNTAIPRATEHILFLNDRTLNPDQPFVTNKEGFEVPNYLFPRKRMIVTAGEVVLYDGPSPYWDGFYPLEVMDWGIEVDHPFGESEVDLYRTLQEAINSLVSGAVHNARLMNNPPKKVTPNVDPQDANDLENYGDEPGRVWTFDSLQDVEQFLVSPYTGEVLEVVKSLLQGIEMMSGLSDASQGKTPKNVTAASAIDQLITASQVVVRLEGRAIEDFLSRMGRLLISRIIQYYTGERLLHHFGPDGEVVQAVYQRSQLVDTVRKLGDGRSTNELLQDIFRDLEFKVKPFSSLESSKQRELQVMLLLHQMGLASGLDVLKTARMPNPEEMLQRAMEEQKQKLNSMMIAKAVGGGKGGKGGGMGGKPAQTPASQKGIPGSSM